MELTQFIRENLSSESADAVDSEKPKYRKRTVEPSKKLAPRKRSQQPPAPELPIYSYKDYKPSPVIVYTRDEDEADEIVQTMKG
jgi:hypothetical protein